MVKLSRQSFTVEDLHEIFMLRYGAHGRAAPIRSFEAIQKMTGLKYQSIAGILRRYRLRNSLCILGRRRNGRNPYVFTAQQEAFLLDLGALRSHSLNTRCIMFR